MVLDPLTGDALVAAQEAAILQQRQDLSRAALVDPAQLAAVRQQQYLQQLENSRDIMAAMREQSARYPMVPMSMVNMPQMAPANMAPYAMPTWIPGKRKYPKSLEKGMISQFFILLSS